MRTPTTHVHSNSARSPHAPRETRIQPLDGLRTLAIAIVVLYHVHMPLFGSGFIGVNIFFVLSGYLITSLLLRERRSTGRIRLGRFWGRRALRLYPTLVAVVIVAACLWFAVGAYDGSNVDVGTAVVLALTYTANIGRWLFHRSMGVLSQTWSLAMEEQFYLVWPPLLALILARRARGILVITGLALLIVASSAISWILYSPRTGTATPDIYFSPILNAAPLLTGCLLAMCLQYPAVARVFRRGLGAVATWIGLVALVALETSIVSGWQRNAAVFGLTLPLDGLATALLIAGIVSRPTSVSRVLSLRPLAWFGRNASYSLYLWHVIVFALVLPLIPGDEGKWIAVTVAAGVAVASHLAIEKPVVLLKARLEARRGVIAMEKSADRTEELERAAERSSSMALVGAVGSGAVGSGVVNSRGVVSRAGGE